MVGGGNGGEGGPGGGEGGGGSSGGGEGGGQYSFSMRLTENSSGHDGGDEEAADGRWTPTLMMHGSFRPQR